MVLGRLQQLNKKGSAFCSPYTKTLWMVLGFQTFLKVLLEHKCIQLYFPFEEKLYFATHFLSPSSSKQARRAICYLIHFQEQKPDALAIVIGTFEHFLITNSVSVFTKCQQFGPDRKTGTENCYSTSSTTKIKTFLVILLQARYTLFVIYLAVSFMAGPFGRTFW